MLQVKNLYHGTEPTNVTGEVQTEGYTDYIPHPGFEFGEAKTGIWAGKYMSSGSISMITIKSGLSFLKNQSVGNYFNAGLEVKNQYGLPGDTHLTKNIEWGAIAYLADSKYGRNKTEVGRTPSAVSGGNVLLSTTGNMNGVFDMSGALNESVAAYLENPGVSSNTNFNSLIAADKKYKDVYIVGSSDTIDMNYDTNKGVKGDGIFETSNGNVNTSSTSASGGTLYEYGTGSGWYLDESTFPSGSTPGITRGRILESYKSIWYIL